MDRRGGCWRRRLQAGSGRIGVWSRPRAVLLSCAVGLLPFALSGAVGDSGRPEALPPVGTGAGGGTSLTVFTVDSTLDSPLADPLGVTCADKESTPRCSLRAAIQAADNLGAPVRVVLSSTVYRLTDTALGALTVSDPAGVTLVGSGTGATVVSVPPGAHYGAVVVNGATSAGASLAVADLTISGGNAGAGGAVAVDTANAAALIEHVTLSGNAGSLGGALYDAGSVQLYDDTISGNRGVDGAGVAVVNGQLSVSGGAIDGNIADLGFGGGLYAKDATVTMSAVSVASNLATSADGAAAGGGVYALGSTVEMTSTSLTENSVSGVGGGIYAGAGTNLQMTGGSVSRNTVTSTGGGGGGLFIAAPTVQLANVAVISNSVPDGSYGGGIADAPDSDGAVSPSARLDVSGGSLSGNSNGGLFVNGIATGPMYVRVSGADLVSNTADAAYDCGAAICVNMPANTSPLETVLTDDRIEGNLESGGIDAAGGVQAESSAAGSHATLVMSSDVVTGNTTSSQGGAGGVAVDLLAASSAFVDIASSTVSDNSAPDGHGGGIQLTTLATGTPTSILAQLTGDTLDSNTSGSASAAAGIGGALFASGDISAALASTSFGSNDALEGPTVSGNGGAVYYTGTGSLELSGDTFAMNEAEGPGASGGAAVLLGGTSYFTDCSFSGNAAGEHGGALYVKESATSVTASTLAGNVAGSSQAGGAAGTGGAVDLASGAFTALNVTFSGNEAATNGTSAGEGGAIFEIEGSGSLDFVTIDGNVAGYGGGLFEVGSSALGFVLHGSILSGNSSPSGTEGDCEYVMGAVTPSSAGGNLLGQAGCVAVEVGGDAISTSPGLSALAMNGGATETMALEPGSPALAIATGCPATDQRGVARPLTACDAGAYEMSG